MINKQTNKQNRYTELHVEIVINIRHVNLNNVHNYFLKYIYRYQNKIRVFLRPISTLTWRHVPTSNLINNPYPYTTRDGYK